MRRELEIFSGIMELKLGLNDHKGGWENVGLEDLMEKLKGEVNELADAMEREPDMNILFEAADVANYAMMIAWNVMKQAAAKPDNNNGHQFGCNCIECNAQEELPF